MGQAKQKAKQQKERAKLPLDVQHRELLLQQAGATRQLIELEGQIAELQKDVESLKRQQLGAMRRLVAFETENDLEEFYTNGPQNLQEKPEDEEEAPPQKLSEKKPPATKSAPPTKPTSIAKAKGKR